MKNLSAIKGVGPKSIASLAEAGITTVRGLLSLLPREYRDMSSPRPLASLHPGEEAYILVMIAGTPRITRTGSLTIVRVMVTDGSDVCEAVWYNQPYLKQQLKEGNAYQLYTRVDTWQGRPRLSNPVFVRETGIVPVYRKIGEIKSNLYRTMVKEALEGVAEAFPEEIPAPIRQEYGLIDLADAIRMAHMPASQEEIALSRRTLAFEELLLYQVKLLGSRSRAERGIVIPCPSERIEEDWGFLPFSPTGAQKRVLNEIARDMASDKAMARLVQGDVGSGKTAVAFMAMLLACRAGYQSALMAPTEVLAQQHYESAIKLLAPHGIRVGLLTGAMTARQHAEARQKLADGEWDVAIGTHALITDNVIYHNLGLVVTDEQHRFGVKQRTLLSQKGRNENGEQVNVLVMSATPIPRSLALILYGDLDLSIVDELPPGKKNAITRLVPEEKREGMYGFIRREIEKGRRAYIVCPLVESSETVDAVNVGDMFKDIEEKFSPWKCALVHGRMKEKEKDEALEAFRKGDAKVLVATTVIEVGVNVPEATVMVIENADRFGLAQLHQLRGRVGRGTGDDVPDSWCFLMAKPDERMRIMVSTNDGFEIAKKDMELRGPGELMGTRQTGEASIGIGGEDCSMVLLKETNEAAKSILSRNDDDTEEIRALAEKKFVGKEYGRN